MKDRLIEFMEMKQLNARQLSEKIGVQPSSISHILTGRNKPSVDLLEKLLKHFPDIDIHYLLTGEKRNLVKPLQERSSDLKEISEQPISPIQEKEKSMQSHNSLKKASSDRIIIFNKNGTYKEYFPE